jgi:hypothetical protein
MRLTLKARGRVFAEYFLRKSDAELAALEGGSPSLTSEGRVSRKATARTAAGPRGDED